LAIIITVRVSEPGLDGMDGPPVNNEPSGDLEARAIKPAPKFTGHMQKVS